MEKIYPPGIFALAVYDGMFGSFTRPSFEEIPSIDSMLYMYEIYRNDPTLQTDSPLTRRMEWLEQRRSERNY